MPNGYFAIHPPAPVSPLAVGIALRRQLADIDGEITRLWAARGRIEVDLSHLDRFPVRLPFNSQAVRSSSFLFRLLTRQQHLLPGYVPNPELMM